MLPRLEAKAQLDDFALRLAAAERGMEDEDRDAFLGELRRQAAGGRQWADATVETIQDAGAKIVRDSEEVPPEVMAGFGLGVPS